MTFGSFGRNLLVYIAVSVNNSMSQRFQFAISRVDLIQIFIQLDLQ